MSPAENKLKEKAKPELAAWRSFIQNHRWSKKTGLAFWDSKSPMSQARASAKALFAWGGKNAFCPTLKMRPSVLDPVFFIREDKAGWLVQEAAKFCANVAKESQGAKELNEAGKLIGDFLPKAAACLFEEQEKRADWLRGMGMCFGNDLFHMWMKAGAMERREEYQDGVKRQDEFRALEPRQLNGEKTPGAWVKGKDSVAALFREQGYLLAERLMGLEGRGNWPEEFKEGLAWSILAHGSGSMELALELASPDEDYRVVSMLHGEEHEAYAGLACVEPLIRAGWNFGKEPWTAENLIAGRVFRQVLCQEGLSEFARLMMKCIAAKEEMKLGAALAPDAGSQKESPKAPRV